MAILDLQGMPSEVRNGHGGGHSGASKGCNNSVLSLLLC
jgi:hypothetical protein